MARPKGPRFVSKADEYWTGIAKRTILISNDLRESIRADLKEYWHFDRLEKFRHRVRKNWNTDDAQRVLLKDEIGSVTREQILLFCNKATAFYYLQGAHLKDSKGDEALIPGVISEMIAREWLSYHGWKPNIEFGHYVANPIRVTTSGPTDIQGIIRAHKSLCKQASEFMAKARQQQLKLGFGLTAGASSENYEINPLYNDVILLVDRFDMEAKRGKNRFFDFERAVSSQSVLIALTGVEGGLSSPISFDTFKGETRPLERPDLSMHPHIEVVRTSLAEAIHFVLDLEEREIQAGAQTVHKCGSDRSLNPYPPGWTWKWKDVDVLKNPDTWADALVKFGDTYGYDEDDSTWTSLRRVLAAMAGGSFKEMEPAPFQSKWKECIERHR